MSIPVDRDEAIRRLEAEGLFVTEWTDTPEVSYPEHSHPFREVRWVLDGEMSVTTGETTRVLRAGDRIDLAPGESHSAAVGPTGVRYLAGSGRHPQQGRVPS